MALRAESQSSTVGHDAQAARGLLRPYGKVPRACGVVGVKGEEVRERCLADPVSGLPANPAHPCPAQKEVHVPDENVIARELRIVECHHRKGTQVARSLVERLAIGRGNGKTS